MAERFRDLVAPNLIDLNARMTPSGGASAAQTLSQSLATISRASGGMADKLRSQIGAREGAAA